MAERRHVRRIGEERTDTARGSRRGGAAGSELEGGGGAADGAELGGQEATPLRPRKPQAPVGTPVYPRFDLRALSA